MDPNFLYGLRKLINFCYGFFLQVVASIPRNHGIFWVCKSKVYTSPKRITAGGPNRTLRKSLSKIHKTRTFRELVQVMVWFWPWCLGPFRFFWVNQKKWATKNTSKWWFQTFFIFTPNWGRFPIWLIFFQMGWNHQLDILVWNWILVVQNRDPYFMVYFFNPHLTM